MASQKGFKMFHLNIRSLVNKHDQLKIELEKSRIDIFSISETWLTAGVDSNILQIPGYSMSRHDGTHVDTGLPKRGGGLAIYYASALSCDSNKSWYKPGHFPVCGPLLGLYLLIWWASLGIFAGFWCHITQIWKRHIM